MAADYAISGYTETSELVGGNKIVKVREYHVTTKPSGIYFQFRRPVTTSAANVQSVAEQLAVRFEAVNKSPNVVGMLYSQNVTAAGQLQDYVTTFYETADGEISGSVGQPMANMGPGTTPKLVAAEIAAGGDFLSP